jgi:hypothetical protein
MFSIQSVGGFGKQFDNLVRKRERPNRRYCPPPKIGYQMRIPIAIVIAGVLIAAAVLIAQRWEISAATGVVYRLDRWTGDILACELNPGPCYHMVR